MKTTDEVQSDDGMKTTGGVQSDDGMKTTGGSPMNTVVLYRAVDIDMCIDFFLHCTRTVPIKQFLKSFDYKFIPVYYNGYYNGYYDLYCLLGI